MRGAEIYRIPGSTHRTSETINRSKFIATLGHASSPGDAKSFIRRIKSEFSDATHNCWAYQAGPPGDEVHVGMSDDGEPRGVAGGPMLKILVHSGVGEIVAVVSRWYGGVKLGKGGLVRAYGGAVKKALASLDLVEKRALIELNISVAYPDIKAVKRIAKSLDAAVTGERYEERCALVLSAPVKNEEELRLALTSQTRGDVRFSA